MTSDSLTLLGDSASRADLEEIISPFRDSLDQVMNKVLCQSEVQMLIDRPESNLGNWASDLLLEKARMENDVPIDAAMFNTGGLRTALPIGPITVGKIFELMPFDNELVLVTIPYNEVQEMLAYLAAKGGEPVSDIRMVIKDGIVIEARIGGNPIEERPYTILTSDYLSNGGDKMYFFTEGRRMERRALGIKIRDAVMSYCEKKGLAQESIKSFRDGRITIGE